MMETLKKSGPRRFSHLQDVVKNPRTLSSKLSHLVDLRLVEKSGGLYTLTKRGEKATRLLVELRDILKTQPPIDVERVPHSLYRPLLRRLCEELLLRFGEDLVGVLLFGSVARPDWTRESDIDLLVVLRRPKWDRREALRELLDVRRALRETSEYKRAMERGYYPTLEFYPLEVEEARRFRRLYLDALTEGIVLFERESFLSNLIKSFKKRLVELGSRRIEVSGVGHYWVLGDIEAGEVLEL